VCSTFIAVLAVLAGLRIGQRSLRDRACATSRLNGNGWTSGVRRATSCDERDAFDEWFPDEAAHLDPRQLVRAQTQRRPKRLPVGRGRTEA
jgi:hypothetical protein